MPATILTTDDLREFKMELIEEMKTIISKVQPKKETTKFLKSAEVMELLQISPGTLQNLRINGTLPFIKLGGVILYNKEEILKACKEHKY
ncbi:helix-turn-helix domain-containing protein [Mesonia sp. MT50]|uniref:Helix-turn-helix domain-containing protein n=1 Tax=Mesonia profundi TaxID=3070998 RepID=A0ABU1A153_9FLAO|nr:helix-turn-helix domain-containing protein [Mesonia profundi]MDQ7917320.1 helix-turn-helix domain-containing protein [Mesonia profundi]